jgi:hypothetical protein
MKHEMEGMLGCENFKSLVQAQDDSFVVEAVGDKLKADPIGLKL